MYKNSESGRSMIEMLGVLMIMGVITAAAVAMITTAIQSTNRAATGDQVTQIVSGVRQIHGQRDDYSGIDNTFTLGAIGVQARARRGSTVFSIEANPVDTRQFIVTIGGLNQSDCKFFSTKAWVDSVGFQMSDGRMGGATAYPIHCDATGGRNSVRIIFQ